ncbi:response regulator [Nitrincola schmidtii]|uniref:response regulator n=1 Tax=Nitrincola schmidtii TaxID=1730894 RepID=UPI00124C5A78|nr:response regulator [Nitrincola schmidtii]
MKEEVCTSRKAAELLGVTPRTIQLWADAGILDSWKTPGGHRRFYLSAVQQLAREILDGCSPVLSDSKAEQQATLLSSKKTQVEPAKILVVDDDKTLLRLYELTINSWGLPIQLTLANDGYQGLIEVGRCNPDLLILDLQMPNIDGFAVVEALERQQLLDQMSLMIISGLDEESLAEHKPLPEDCTVIQKPIPFLRIREQVEKILLSR